MPYRGFTITNEDFVIDYYVITDSKKAMVAQGLRTEADCKQFIDRYLEN